MKYTIKIVTDSASDIPDSFAQAHNITVIPLTIRFGDEEYVDRVELTPERFVELLGSHEQLPSTAAPSPGAFEAAFRQASTEGYEHVICITLASGLSATFQSAINGATFVSGIIDVRVFDSEQCTIAQAALVHKAVALTEAGAPIENVMAALENLRGRLRLISALDTIENLRRGGRIGAARAFFGSLLSIKPCIEIAHGEVKPLARQRTRARSFAFLLDVIKENMPVSDIVVGHVAASDIEELLLQLKQIVGDTPIAVSDVGPVIGTHGGKGLVGIAFARPETPQESSLQ